MIDEKLTYWIVGGLFGIIFFFIRNSVFARMNAQDAKTTALENRVNEHETKIELAKSNHSNLDKRFDQMDANFNKLYDKISEFIMKSAK